VQALFGRDAAARWHGVHGGITAAWRPI